MTKNERSKTKEAEQLELGKKLQQFYESGYVNKKQAILFSFYKGVAAGFGAFLGGTILIALLIGFLGLFDQFHLIDAIRDTLVK